MELPENERPVSEPILPVGRPQRRLLIAALACSILIGSAGVSAAAAVNFDSKHRNVLLEGVTVGTLNVGGMDFSSARALVHSKFEAPLDRPLLLDVNERILSVTPRELGVTTNAMERLEQARSLHRAMPLWKRVLYRITDFPLGHSLDVKTGLAQDRVKSYVDEVAKAVEGPPQDASISLDGDRLVIVPEKIGFALDREGAEKGLHKAIISGDAALTFEGHVTAPKVRRSDFSTVIVIKTGENKLYFYRYEELVKVYPIATGEPGFPTPTGKFKIVNKRRNPTWVNPAKYEGGWGWDLPERIFPGPGNPLGTRALDLSAPGIRIHGTYASSSIGYNASHGCIRMRISDSEELFEQVSVGTPVMIVHSGFYRTMRRRASSPQPEPSAESDATVVPGQAPASEQQPAQAA